MKYIQSFFEAGYVGYPSAIASGSAKTLKTREGNRPDDSKDGDNDDELDEGKTVKICHSEFISRFSIHPYLNGRS